MIIAQEVERWGMFELELDAQVDGNPFTEVQLSAKFRHGMLSHVAEGFYNGHDTFLIRFMPCEIGEWQFITKSNCPELDGISGTFLCSEPSGGNHGPVRAYPPALFRYADGKAFRPIGTTSYVWHQQSEELQQQTLDTLKRSPFNKVRMSILPMYNEFNEREPSDYPFSGSPASGFDFFSIRPEYFDSLENDIKRLGELGIEAELVLFHPYDGGRWGFDRMPPEADESYLRYIVARFAAFRNIWWAIACDYDRMEYKKSEDWDRLFRILQECDYGYHLRSIHNHDLLYDYGKPWITHASIRHNDIKIVSECAEYYGKPIVIDECGFEGHIHTSWGSLTPDEMLYRMWEGNTRGGYVTHGESYMNQGAIQWWLHGGSLREDSLARLAFLKQIMDELPPEIAFTDERKDASTLEQRNSYILQYFGAHRFKYREFVMSEGQYEVDIIDTWNMTVQTLDERFEGRFRIDLPAELYYAVRIRKVS